MPKLPSLRLAAGAIVLAALFVIVSRADKAAKWDLPPEPGAPNLSRALKTQLSLLPDDAAILYHDNGYIYATDKNGHTATQISFEKPQSGWEHVAASPDRRFVAANEQLPNPEGKPGGMSRVWLFDLKNGTRQRLVPGFRAAGNGGIDWDRNGNIYFAAQDKDLFPRPGTPDEFRANAGENDIYRIKYDGTGLQRLTHTKDRGESDVSVSEDGAMIAYNCFRLSDEKSEIWVAQADGSHPRLVLEAGKDRVDSVHDPELSPDNKKVVYSRVNAIVPPNFPDNPDANTAHDIYVTDVDGSHPMRLTRPGPISIAPDWTGNDVLFLDISEQERRASLAIVKPDAVDQTPRRLDNGTNIGKWIPE